MRESKSSRRVCDIWRLTSDPHEKRKRSASHRRVHIRVTHRVLCVYACRVYTLCDLVSNSLLVELGSLRRIVMSAVSSSSNLSEMADITPTQAEHIADIVTSTPRHQHPHRHTQKAKGRMRTLGSTPTRLIEQERAPMNDTPSASHR